MNSASIARCPRCRCRTMQGLNERGEPVCAGCKRSVVGAVAAASSQRPSRPTGSELLRRRMRGQR